MTTQPHQMPSGELFAVSDRAVLLDDVQTIAAMGTSLGTPTGQPLVLMTVAGRRNHSEDRDDLTLVLNAEGATKMLDVLTHTLEFMAAHSKDA